MGVLAWRDRSISGTDADARDTVRSHGRGRSAPGIGPAARADTGSGAGGAAARVSRGTARLAARATRPRDIGAKLEAALIAAAAARGCGATVIEAGWTGWASVTFTGARHRILLEMDATAAAEQWLAGLPDQELALRGHLLADLHVLAIEDHHGRRRATLEALTVEEC